ncbi:MAG TPA: metal ABC transporter substrate-binding protein [Anaerolineales bacterium]
MLRKFTRLFGTINLLLFLAACGSGAAPQPAPGGKLQVMATTTIVGDVVQNVAGYLAEVSILLPVGVDPHSFEPNPKDAAKISGASLVFANGAGYEEFLKPLLSNAGSKAEVVSLADGIKLINASDLKPSEGDSHPGGDPHTWFDPDNVQVWAQTIAQKMGAADPAHAAEYAANAQKYQAQLKELDAWIRGQVTQVPEANRQLVTDHDSFTYFAARYSFKLVGAVIPGYSSVSQPSAQELAGLEDAIRKLGVKAVFVGETAGPVLVQRVAQDTGVKLVTLYGESLSKPAGPAPTYLELMRYDVNAIVSVLK